MINIKTIDDNLAKAKADVAFWENAKTVLLDPRISQIAGAATPAPTLPPADTVIVSAPRPYGEVKRKVYEALPEVGSMGISCAEIAAAMEKSGYRFTSRVPTIAVNEALASLGDQVYMAGKKGLAKLWTKAAPAAVTGGDQKP